MLNEKDKKQVVESLDDFVDLAKSYSENKESFGIVEKIALFASIYFIKMFIKTDKHFLDYIALERPNSDALNFARYFALDNHFMEKYKDFFSFCKQADVE